MTKEELARCDGQEGRRAWVAVNGKIYDFTDSNMWRAGNHAGRHRAGCDLSAELAQAPHVRAVIERFPVVAELLEDAPAERKRPWPAWIVSALALIGVLWFLLR
ncbi:MAG: cytochrome b5 domain-containing protein [Desulfuromonadales bacterium]|jgi:predicted heme/steroid binding protein